MVPSVPVFGSFSAKHRVHHRRGAGLGGELELVVAHAGMELLDAPAHDLREGRDDRGHLLLLAAAVRASRRRPSPRVFASVSSFNFNHAWSFARMSMESDLASAPKARGCSLPLTHTSNGCGGPFSTWPTNTAKRDCGCSIM